MAKARLYDAFPTKAGAKGAASDINASTGRTCATARKLKAPQDGGRLKYGVFVKPIRGCML